MNLESKLNRNKSLNFDWWKRSFSYMEWSNLRHWRVISCLFTHYNDSPLIAFIITTTKAKSRSSCCYYGLLTLMLSIHLHCTSLIPILMRLCSWLKSKNTLFFGKLWTKTETETETEKTTTTRTMTKKYTSSLQRNETKQNKTSVWIEWFMSLFWWFEFF